MITKRPFSTNGTKVLTRSLPSDLWEEASMPFSVQPTTSQLRSRGAVRITELTFTAASPINNTMSSGSSYLAQINISKGKMLIIWDLSVERPLTFVKEKPRTDRVLFNGTTTQAKTKSGSSSLSSETSEIWSVYLYIYWS